jgi:flagellar basal-body rod protein FlgG
MLNGLYTATSGLAMQHKRVEVIANNLANLNTTGHKREIPVFSEYIANAGDHPDDVIRNSEYNQMINSTVRMHDIKTSFSQGYLKETGNTYDFALGKENQFFAVDTPFGIRFTRDGEFMVDSDGELATKDGYKLLSNLEVPQYVNIPQDQQVIFSENGDLLLNGAPIDTVAIAQFEDTKNLQKTGKNLYVAVGALPEDAEDPQLIQGYVEGSNVNPIQEMVRMIDASRGFESYQKMVQTVDDLNSKAVNEVGSAR